MKKDLNSNKEVINSEILTERVHIRNTNDATEEIFELTNFAGQGRPQNQVPIGFVYHNYTDGNMAQFDNVGQDNNILILKNARNPIRRSDKPNDFIGNANFIVGKEAYLDGNTEKTKDVFILDKNSKFTTTKTLLRQTDKKDDDSYAISDRITNKHHFPYALLNGDEFIYVIKSEENKNYIEYINPTTVNFKKGIGIIQVNKEDDGLWGYALRLENKHENVLSILNGEDFALVLNKDYLDISGGIKLKPVQADLIKSETIFIDVKDKNLKFKNTKGEIKNISLT